MLLSFLLLLGNFCLWQKERKDLIYTYIAASTVWTLFLGALTEFLSLFHAMTLPWVLLSWLCFAGLLLALLVHQCKNMSDRKILSGGGFQGSHRENAVSEI